MYIKFRCNMELQINEERARCESINQLRKCVERSPSGSQNQEEIIGMNMTCLPLQDSRC